MSASKPTHHAQARGGARRESPREAPKRLLPCRQYCRCRTHQRYLMLQTMHICIKIDDPRNQEVPCAPPSPSTTNSTNRL
ncbi:hypothetical protein ABIC63_003435 [Pseudacidovorax sp. 1753]